jgi:hypothetical protein
LLAARASFLAKWIINGHLRNIANVSPGDELKFSETPILRISAIKRTKALMSIQTLRLDLECRSGRELLPSSFPIELLIKMTRELSLVAHRSLSFDELSELNAVLVTYMRRVIEMQCAELLAAFDARADMFPQLAHELYACLQEEMVSRLISGDIKSLSLRDRIVTVFDDERQPV